MYSLKASDQETTLSGVQRAHVATHSIRCFVLRCSALNFMPASE